MYKYFALIASACLTCVCAAQSIYIDTPGLHDIGSLDGDPYFVYVGSKPDGTLVGGVDAYIDSTATKVVDSLFMRSDSRLEYSSDHFSTINLELTQSSSLAVSGGLLTDAHAKDDSSIRFDGGYAVDLRASDRATLHAGGGSVMNLRGDGHATESLRLDAEISWFSDQARVEVWGGSYDKAHLNGSSLVNVHGLTGGTDFIAYDTSRINVFGGGGLPFTRYETYGGIVNFWGHDLTATFDRLWEASYQVPGAYWTLSGTLLDGTSVSNVQYFEAFGSGDQARFLRLHNDAVPEPATWLYVAGGLAASLRRRRTAPGGETLRGETR